jgi:DNA-binding PadR family transcriptional regulator
MLQLLEDEGLARGGESDGRRTYELTDEGRAEAERRSAAGAPLWASDDPAAQGQMALREAVGQLHGAARQVGSAGSPEQVERATAALRQARQTLYSILAES